MTSHLAIVLPGRLYGPLGPALRIPVLALQQVGAEVAVVDYPSEPDRDPGAWEPLYESVAQQVAALTVERRPRRVTFLAKSLGTAALAALPPGLPVAERIDAIWVTPLFGQGRIRSAAKRRAWPSLVVAGAADSLHDAAGHEEVCRTLDAASVVLTGADHSLEVPGDVMATVAGFERMAAAVLDFLSGSHTG